MQKTIATLLIICMMFSLVPPQTGMFDGVYENVFAGQGSIGDSTGASPGKPGSSNGKGGVIDGTTASPSFRVTLSRNKLVKVDADTNSDTYKKLMYNMGFQYAPFSEGQDIVNDTMFFIPNYAKDGKSQSWPYSLYQPGATGRYVYYTNNPSTTKSLVPINGTQHLMQVKYDNVTSPPTNVFKKRVTDAYKNKTITSTTDLANDVWKNYLPNVDEARKIWSYVLQPKAGMQDRILNVTDENFNKPLKDLSREEQFNTAAGFTGLLASLYVLASDTTGGRNSAALANSYAKALNDYFSNNNLNEIPVTLMIDPCSTYNMRESMGYCITPCIDLLEFALAVQNSASITDGEFFYADYSNMKPGTTRQMIEAMAKQSLIDNPFEISYGYIKGNGNPNTKQIFRLTDRNGETQGANNSLQTAVGRIYGVFSLMDVIWTAKGDPYWQDNWRNGHFDILHLNYDGGIDGYVLVGSQASDPAPIVSYNVNDSLMTTEDPCSDFVKITKDAQITVSIGGTSDFMDFVNNLPEDTKILVESKITRTEYLNAVTGTPVEVKQGGFASEGGAQDTDMAVLQGNIDKPYTRDEFIEAAQRTITFPDTSLKNHEPIKKELNGNKLLIFKYDIDIRLTINEQTWDFKAANIVKKSGTAPLNIVQVTIPPHKEPGDYCDDIVIPKPSSPTTTEIVDPSKDEKLEFNTRMIRRFEYTSTVGKSMAAKGVADIDDANVAAFAELKSNMPLEEEFEVLAGIPSSEEIYFSVGGSEYKVAIIMQYWMNEHSRDRTYTIHFDGTTCEYNNNVEKKGDVWPGASTVTQPTAAGGVTPSTTDVKFTHEGGTVTVTWSGKERTTCTYDSSCPFTHDSCPVTLRADYKACKAAAEALVNGLNSGVQLTWTSASDEAVRNFNFKCDNASASITTDTKGADGSAGSHADLTVCSGDPPSCTTTPCGSDSPGKACVTSFTITVTITMPPHAICGPCCGHELPDLYDTWRQGLVYDYAKVGQIRLYLLDQGSVDGMTELVGTDRIVANIVTGNPTYFMNIAQMTEQNNPFYPQKGTASLTGDKQGSGMTFYGSTGKNGDESDMYSGIQGNWNRWEAQSSRAGRLRYVLDPTNEKPETRTLESKIGTKASFTLNPELVANSRQHDDVIYTVGTRSAICDGMATTNNFGKSSANNVLDMETTGHNNAWGIGCLYTNIQDVTDYTSYHEADSLAYTYDPKELKENDANVSKYKEDYNHHIVRDGGADKSTYSDKADTKDTKTAEWQIFNDARRTKIIVDVISDFLIMQTSGGDQSIFYFEKVSPGTEAQEHFQKIKATQQEMFTDNPLSVFKAFDGECGDICNDGDGNSTIKPDIRGFEIIGGYNGRYDVPSKKYLPYSNVTKEFLSFYGTHWSKYDASYDRSNWTTKVGGDYNPHGETEIITVFDKDPAGTISRPERQAISQKESFKIMQDNIQILPTAPNKFYQPENAMVWYSQVAALYSPDIGAMDMEMPQNGLYVGAAKQVDLGWAQRAEYADVWKTRWGNSIGLEISTKYYLTEDGDSNTSSINGVIVYTPVSTEKALVLPQGDLTIDSVTGKQNIVSRDQRVDGFNRIDKNDKVNKLKVCTLDPATCEFRYLDCKYLHETVLASFNFEPTYMGTEPDVSGNYPQNLKPKEKPNTFEKDGKYITTNLITGIQYELPAGYTITSGGGFGTGKYLSATGSTAWSIPFSDLGLSAAKYNRVKVSMDLKVNASSDNIMVAGFKNLGFIINSSGSSQFISPDEKIQDMVGTSKDLGTKDLGMNIKNVKLDIVFSFNNIVDCTAYVDGIEAPVTAVKDYRTVWKNSTNAQGFATRQEVTDMVTLEGEVLQNSPPANLTTGDISGYLNIGTWNNANSRYNYSANYYIDNLEIVLMGGTTEHNSSCYTTSTSHSSVKIHVCDDKCILKEDVYQCDGALNDDYEHNDDYSYNSHVCTAACKSAITAGTKTDYYYRSHYDTQNITGYVVTLGSYSYIWPGSGNYVYRYDSQCGRDYNMPSSVLGNATSSGYVTLDSTSYPGDSGHSTIVYKYKLVEALTLVSGTVYVDKCNGELNTHTHIGIQGASYPNGCYTVPTIHTHNVNVKELICGIPEGGDGQVRNYSTVGETSVTLPAGRYKLEVWGAQGGENSNNEKGAVGKGGYSTGIATFNSATPVYVVVGGQGTASAGGYNGGGGGYGGGGGATHIATASGVLKDLSSNQSSVLVVAGGAGGTEYSSDGYGGAGGGYEAQAGFQFGNAQGSGGTQTTGYAFGEGETVTGSHQAGGGGGWYGGKSTDGYNYSGSSTSNKNAGGGSGYVKSTLESPSSIVGTSSMPAPSGGNETGHAGNGYARITNLDHQHTDSCYRTTSSSCPKIPAGEHVCTGELNTLTDLNAHIHDRNCLEVYKNLTPTNFFYTGDMQTYEVPYTDYYKIEVYGAGNNTVGYASGVVKLKAGTDIYVYVGGTNGYNNFESDVRFVKYSGMATTGGYDVEIETNDKLNDVSYASRLMTAGATKDSAETFTVGDYVLTDVVTKGMGGSGTGRVVFTPLNRLPMENGQKTILNQILDGDIPETQAQKYLGEELADIIISTAQPFKVYENFSWTNYQGFVKDSNLISFANSKIISRIANGVGGWEFHVPVNIEAKSLRQVRITLDNNTNTTTIGVGINGGQKEVTTSVDAKKAGQVITIPVSDKWWDDNITSLYFDLYPGTPNETGTIEVSKIELIGHADLTQNVSGYGYTELKTISGFSSDDTKGFTVRNNATISYNGSNMRVTATGSDPITDWNTISSIAADAVKAIKIVFTNNSGAETHGQLFYKSASLGETEDNSFLWNIGATASEQTVWIDTVNKTAYNATTGSWYTKGAQTWSGNITGMRFDWGALASGSIDVKSITFIGNGSATGTGSYEGNDFSQTFDTPGSPTSVLLPVGRYKLEVWGAEGGSFAYHNNSAPGKGGYSSATYNVTTPTRVYVTVGGSGTDNAWRGTGGYNGGGVGSAPGGGATHMALSSVKGGGSAPDICYGSPSDSTPYCWLQTNTGCAYEDRYAYSNSSTSFSYHCSGWVRAPQYDYNVEGLLASLSSKTSDILLVAGGGAGSSGSKAGGDGGSAVTAATAGGQHCGTAGQPGTTTSGGTSGSCGTAGTFGQGGSNTCSGGGTDSGSGGGGGYYGGGAGGHDHASPQADDSSGGGGSGYASSILTDVTGETGVRTGDGYAKITGLYTSSPVTITASTPTTQNIIAKYKNPFENKTTAQQTIFQNINKIPEYVDGDYNPIFICKFEGFNVHDCDNCTTTRKLDCTEPHHKGFLYDKDGNIERDDDKNPICKEHYSGANKICWSACGKDENHKNTHTEITIEHDDKTTEVLRLAEFLQIDEGFTVYFPNVGDFYGNGVLGLSSAQLTRGYGYEDNMDTTRWTREKRVKFAFDVIYAPSEKSGEPMAIYRAGSWIELHVPDEYFNFYILVSNPEIADAKVEFECEAINCGTEVGLEPKIGINYTDRIGTIYAEKLNIFITEYLQNWYDDILDGGYIRSTAEKNEDDSGNKNTNGTRAAIKDFGYMDFYITKQEEDAKKLREALDYIDTQVEKDFEGTDNDYIDPHHIDGGGSDEYDGINQEVKDITFNDNKVRFDNAMRSNSLQHLHGGYKSFYLDVIGRIGNFAITDTEDFRFSNFFKVPIISDGDTEGLANPNNWLVEGLVKQVDDAVQNLYVGDMYDIRGNAAAVNNRWLDTYGTQGWMAGQLTGAGRDITKPNLVSQILTGEVNNIEVLKEEQLRYGYDIYTSLVTFGSYENGQVQVVPKYYALKVTDKNLEGVPDKYNVPKGYYLPIDVYINKDGVYAPVNIFGNAGNGNPNKGDLRMNDYVFNVDWTVEGDRRNYSLEEIARTNRVKEHFKDVIYDYSGTGADETVDVDISQLPILDIVEYITPEGSTNYLGTAQYILMNAKHRTFIGSSNSYDNNDGGVAIWNSKAGLSTFQVDKGAYPDGYNLNDYDPDDASTRPIEEIDFERGVQRWHGKLGLPSSAVFVPHGLTVDGTTLEYIMGENQDDWVIVCTAEMIAVGAVWNINYSQPWFTAMTINGESFATCPEDDGKPHYPGHRDSTGALCSKCLDPIIAVFGKTSVDDVEIIQIY